MEVVGLEHVPTGPGGVLVAWHPNGLVDPAIILSAFPGDVAFGARSGLFRVPLLGALLRSLGTVPIHRHQDQTGEDGCRDGTDERRRRNEASLDALAARVASGSFSALFPEGVSHDAPSPRALKTGAARLYYRARALAPPDGPVPVVIPVGLHYDQKRVFRSAALVQFHPPMALPPELDVTPPPDEEPERARELARALTRRVEAELESVVLATENWEVHRLLHRARKLVRAERASRAGRDPGGATMDEKVIGLARVWTAYRARLESDPEGVEKLERRVRRYDGGLRGLGLDDHELDRPAPVFKPWLWLILLSQAVSVFLLLPPFLLVGYVVNLPPAVLVSVVADAVGREDKDVASLKVIGGTLVFPMTWAAWAWLAAWGHGHPAVRTLAPWLPESPALAAAITVVLSTAGALLMLVYADLARSTWRAVRVRLTRGRRARSILRLRVERSRLCDALLGMAAGIPLPGAVREDGVVVRTPGPDPDGTARGAGVRPPPIAPS